jgi:probable HAF family extracellular repeat protein
MVDITPLGWAWAIATGIDSQGRIVGYGLNPQNKEHAFLLTPNVIVKGGPGGNGNQTQRLEVPEPASSALALFGAAAFLSARGRRRARASCG